MFFTSPVRRVSAHGVTILPRRLPLSSRIPTSTRSPNIRAQLVSLSGHKQMMAQQRRKASTGEKAKRPVPEPRPSSSILLLSPTNQVLLLHRVKTSTSFASAHVFPGGNLDSYQDGAIPPVDSPERHQDGPAYRLGAIRECFEETGILLATRKEDVSPDVDDCDRVLVSLPPVERDAARKRVHANEQRFADLVASLGGVPDVDRLIPFTRWVTPTNVGRRFSTQMYLYMFPDVSLSPSSTAAKVARQQEIIVATPDGGVEHTTARFDDAAEWLAKADRGEIILFPPQYYLLQLVSQFCTGGGQGNSSLLSPSEFAAQRDRLREFLDRVPTSTSTSTTTSSSSSSSSSSFPGQRSGPEHPTSLIPWSEKVMSPYGLFARKQDGRIVLGLDKPGPELQDTGRGGDWERVVVVRFAKDGPREVEVRLREEVLREEKEAERKEGAGNPTSGSGEAGGAKQSKL